MKTLPFHFTSKTDSCHDSLKPILTKVWHCCHFFVTSLEENTMATKCQTDFMAIKASHPFFVVGQNEIIYYTWSKMTSHHVKFTTYRDEFPIKAQKTCFNNLTNWHLGIFFTEFDILEGQWPFNLQFIKTIIILSWVLLVMWANTEFY